MANAVWIDLFDAAQSVTQSLGLAYQGAPLPDGQVYSRLKQLTSQNVTFPCVQFALGGREQMEKGSFENTVIAYPLLCAVVVPSNRSLTADPDALLWRQLVTDAFLDLPRPEVQSADVYDCRIDPDPPVEAGPFKEANLDVGALTLWFYATRRRPGR